MIYLDNAATSFHKPDCVLRAVVEAMQHAGNSGRGQHAAKAMAAQGLFLIQDARSQRCLTYGDRNVWPLHPMTRKRSISPCREHFIQRRELSMRSVRRWITTVCSVRCTAWKKRHGAYDPAGRPQGTDLPYGA